MRALFTTYEGGGHVPATLVVARRLVEEGHAALVVSDAVTKTGDLPHEPWRTAPNRTSLASVADDPLDDWRSRWPPHIVRSICDAVITGPALRYARDTLASIERFAPDVVVSQELLFGAMMAAEVARLPLVLLTGNLWCFPTRADVPPFGPGFRPAASPRDARRDRIVRRVTRWLYDAGKEDLNRARAALGLPPLAHVLDQLDVAERVVLGTARAFDFVDDDAADPRFAYAGPLISVPPWANGPSTGAPPASAHVEDAAPLVLVSFSTTFQDQQRVVARCIQALARLPVRGIVTLGPAVDAASLPRAANVDVVTAASHDELVPRCALVVCHGGHGTVLRPLMHGVPLVILPMGRDQPENAVRVAARGAGLVLSPRASVGAIARAVVEVLGAPSFRAAARALGAGIAAERDGGRRAASLIAAMGRRAPPDDGVALAFPHIEGAPVPQPLAPAGSLADRRGR